MKDFQQKYQEDINYVENTLKKYSEYNYALTKGLTDACNYAVFSGGKRIRPIIMLETFKCFNDNLLVIEPFFVAISMIHTYSLIHDDLPSLDNDDLRRGKPTVHKVYGEDIALLAGDALLNKSFEIMSEASINLGIHELGIRAISVLSNKSGEKGMVGGQFVDIVNEGKKSSKNTLSFIHENKTSALIEASFMIGAILGGANMATVNKFEQIGKNIGMAFQIQDDILDVISTTDDLGKPVGSDLKNAKHTFVDLYGLDRAKIIYNEYYNEAKRIIANMNLTNDFLANLIEFLEVRDK